MKYTNVMLRDLETFEDHDEAIQSIENDYHNVVGGMDAWLSGHETYLLEGAKKKIESIRARMDRLFPFDEEED